jgi:hypothetical protein
MTPMGTPKRTPMSVPSVASSSVAGKTRHRPPEIAVQHLDGVIPELHVQGKIQPQLDPDLLVHVRRGALSHGREDGIDRQHATDEEGDEEEAEERRRGLCDDPERREGVDRCLGGKTPLRGLGSHFFAIA